MGFCAVHKFDFLYFQHYHFLTKANVLYNDVIVAKLVKCGFNLDLNIWNFRPKTKTGLNLDFHQIIVCCQWRHEILNIKYDLFRVSGLQLSHQRDLTPNYSQHDKIINWKSPHPPSLLVTTSAKAENLQEISEKIVWDVKIFSRPKEKVLAFYFLINLLKLSSVSHKTV